VFTETEPGRWFVGYGDDVAPVLGWVLQDGVLEPVILLLGKPKTMSQLEKVDWRVVSAKEVSNAL
jgi:hypothetical protein